MDYTTLVAAKSVQGSIRNWVNRADIPPEVIVEEAESWVYEEMGLRAREMVTTETITFSTTSNEQTLPTGFMDPLQFLPYEHSVPLPYVGPEGLKSIRTSSGDLEHGDPSKWAIVGTEMHINTIPSDPYSGVLMFYARPEALGVGNTTNFLTNRYSAMFRRILLAKAYSHMKDYARAGDEFKVAMGMMEQIKQRADLYLRSADLDEY